MVTSASAYAPETPKIEKLATKALASALCSALAETVASVELETVPSSREDVWPEMVAGQLAARKSRSLLRIRL